MGPPTDVLAIGRLRTLAYRYDRPVPWGCGIELGDVDPLDPTHFFQSLTGTLGGIVYDADGTEFVLSNAHVIAPGPTPMCVGARAGLQVFQGSPDWTPDQVANPTCWIPVVPLTNILDPACWNYVDAAIARVTHTAATPTPVRDDANDEAHVHGWYATQDVTAHMPLCGTTGSRRTSPTPRCPRFARATRSPSRPP